MKKTEKTRTEKLRYWANQVNSLRIQGKNQEAEQLVKQVRADFQIKNIKECLPPRLLTQFNPKSYKLSASQRKELNTCAKCPEGSVAAIFLRDSNFFYKFGDLYCKASGHSLEKRPYYMELPLWKKYGLKPKGPLSESDILKIVELQSGKKYLSISEFIGDRKPVGKWEWPQESKHTSQELALITAIRKEGFKRRRLMKMATLAEMRRQKLKKS